MSLCFINLCVYITLQILCLKFHGLVIFRKINGVKLLTCSLSAEKICDIEKMPQGYKGCLENKRSFPDNRNAMNRIEASRLTKKVHEVAWSK